MTIGTFEHNKNFKCSFLDFYKAIIALRHVVKYLHSQEIPKIEAESDKNSKNKNLIRNPPEGSQNRCLDDSARGAVSEFQIEL